MSGNGDTKQPSSPNQLLLPTFTLPPQGQKIIGPRGEEYTIGDLLGEGAFGVVYECVDSWGNHLAAKIIRPRNLSYSEIKQSAQAEFEKLHALRNPFITHVFDAFEFKHTFYIVTERCSSPLQSLISIPNYDGSVWLKPIARSVLQAVHYIHDAGFVHQDIHLGNVFYSFVADELVASAPKVLKFKVGDLGITKLISEMNPETSILARWMLAPEFLRPEEFGKMDHRMDIYHCGLLFLQVLLGRQLKFSEDEIIEGQPRQLAEQMTSPFATPIAKALRRHVEYRTQSALQLWGEIIAADPSDSSNEMQIVQS